MVFKAMEKIDFVIPWVDGADSRWKSEKGRYEKLLLPGGSSPDESTSADELKDQNADCRYRDLGFLRYWFRGIEQFAPWVNRIFFVTCGQKPAWLNTEHPKLVMVNHCDYIPQEYLPTFNANTIELNFHRIEGLSEHFVYFNDDMFLLQPVTPDYFFKNGDPVLLSSLKYPNYLGINNWSHLVFNDYCLVNSKHDIGKSIWRNRQKWFSVKALGWHRAFRNVLCYLANKSLPVGNYDHLALPHLKSTLAETWEKGFEELDHASSFKFRSDEQVNQWLFCAWNQAIGRFSPAQSGERGIRIGISPLNIDWICGVIEGRTYPQVCLNDTQGNTDPVACSEKIIDSFNRILPQKSSFELE